MNNRYNHVYLSPHLDDAILSCGSLINKQKRHKESVLIITMINSLEKKMGLDALQSNPTQETSLTNKCTVNKGRI